jgi:hypothetical protein
MTGFCEHDNGLFEFHESDYHSKEGLCSMDLIVCNHFEVPEKKSV